MMESRKTGCIAVTFAVIALVVQLGLPSVTTAFQEGCGKDECCIECLGVATVCAAEEGCNCNATPQWNEVEERWEVWCHYTPQPPCSDTWVTCFIHQ